MAYGGLSRRWRRWWRGSPDLAMPDSARHRRDALDTDTPSPRVTDRREGRGAKREPARVVDDVRRRDLEELDVVGRRGLALPVVAPALDQPRRPQAAGEGVARLDLHELSGRRLRAARVVVLAPARRDCETRRRRTPSSSRGDSVGRQKKRTPTKRPALDLAVLPQPTGMDRAARHLLIQPGRLEAFGIGTAPAHQFFI